MLFSWQNKCYRTDSAKNVQHKKRHEVLNATPANTEVIMKRLGSQPASVHHTESILLVLSCNVKDISGKTLYNWEIVLPCAVNVR